MIFFYPGVKGPPAYGTNGRGYLMEAIKAVSAKMEFFLVLHHSVLPQKLPANMTPWRIDEIDQVF